MKLSDYEIERIDGLSKCPICGKMCKPLGLPSHFHNIHNPDFVNQFSVNGPWNKGLTKETSEAIRKSSEKVSQTLSGRENGPLTDSHKLSISNSMIKAHEDGKAWNIGKSRWNNEPSYPESFFMRVIENEFDDKEYVQELSFLRFALDFAWPHKMKCIEIDGEQHERFEEYRKRDLEKDRLLNEHGWQVLRIKWKDMFKSPKEWILIAKNFID